MEKEITQIREALKRCSPETIEAAIRFRVKDDSSAVPVVVLGIIHRYLPAGNPWKAEDLEKNKQLRLIQDLGLDSLTLLEVVVSIEEALGIEQIDNEELRQLQTIGEIKKFISQKIQAGKGLPIASSSNGKSYFSKEQILCLLPQQPPFLFLDNAEIDHEHVRAQYRVSGEEYFLQGHFKGNPVFPASILFESLGQAGCLWVLARGDSLPGKQEGAHEVVFASMGESRFHRKIFPGETLDLELQVIHKHYPLVVFNGGAKVGGEPVASVESLGLMLIPSKTGWNESHGDHKAP